MLALVQAARVTPHDRLDGAMFWVGLSFVVTPLLIGGTVLGYLWWKRRRARTANGTSQPRE